MLLDIRESLLIICDVQENNTPATVSPRIAINGAVSLLKAAVKLEIPYIITEISPKIFGRTLFDVRNIADTANILEKDTFSGLGNQFILDKIKLYNKKQVVLCGVETHINVLQTAVELKALGLEVFVALDACSAKDEINDKTAIYRMLAENIKPTSITNIIFEWLRKPSHPVYKELLFR
jgi:hypothetical protein